MGFCLQWIESSLDSSPSSAAYTKNDGSRKSQFLVFLPLLKLFDFSEKTIITI